MRVRPSVLLERNKQILLLKYQLSDSVLYNLPGGKPDPNETIKETVIREIKEELSIDIEVEQLIFIAHGITQENAQSVLHLVFSGKILSSNSIKLNPLFTTASAFEWVDLADLDKINLYPAISSYIIQQFQDTFTTPYLIDGFSQPWF